MGQRRQVREAKLGVTVAGGGQVVPDPNATKSPSTIDHSTENVMHATGSIAERIRVSMPAAPWNWPMQCSV